MQTVFIAFTLKNSSVAEFFVSLANKLSKTHRVFIFTYATEAHDLSLDSSIEVLEWPSKRPTKLADFRFLVKNIREYKPKTLIASFGAVNLFMLAGFLLKVKHRVAWYHTLTSQLEFKRLLFWRKKAIYKLATRIIANSASAELDVKKAFGINKNKVEVISNAVNNPCITAETNRHKLVYAGRLHSIKGIKVLFKALEIVKEKYPDIILEVIGGEDEPGMMSELLQLTKKLKLEENVQFAGSRQKDYVLQAFSTAYCSIVPSYFEAFGYVVIESFSVHTPVIGSNTTGIAEIIQNEASGLLFEPGNHGELASQINRLLTRPQLRDKLSEKAYEQFLKKYELNRVIGDFVGQSIIFK